MRKIYLSLSMLLIAVAFSFLSNAQNNFFADAPEARMGRNNELRVIVPNKYRTLELNVEAMRTFLWALPDGKTMASRSQAPVLELPAPDGTTRKYRVWESSIQEPALEQKFPTIKTFAGQGIDDPYATIRFDMTPRGFHAQVLTVNGTYYIDPYAVGATDRYISYFRQDLSRQAPFVCGVPDPTEPPARIQAACRGTELRTYRLAVACTGEYAQAPGINAGSDPNIVHAAIVTTVNRVVGVYEVELAISMVLIANNNIVEYLNAATDPFTGNNNANTLIDESQDVIGANIGAANYDIGHTFSTGGGGLAQLNSVCGGNKARGITGSSNPTGDAYDIDYVAHEVGHQFGGNHSMNGCGSSPSSTKYEPGSGTTIQAYAGICGTQNIQPNSDPIFHPISFDEISNFLSIGNGGSCGVVTPTNNTLPVIAPLTNNNVSIPPSTPFTLTGSATDADGDALTYSWDEWDLGNPNSSWNAGATLPAGNTAPLFRSRLPKTTGSRTFPDISVILAGFPSNPPSAMNGLKGETLSPVARPMKFKLTVRDNRAGGGGVVSSGTDGCQTTGLFQVNVVGTQPFTVTSPNGGESFAGGSSQTITWNVAGTDAAPVNVSNVRITLSTDGGLTYPTEIVASTPNDGSELLTIPALVTTTARIRIEALGNIFFDISNANFTITVPASSFDFGTPAAVDVACAGATTASVILPTTATGGFNTPIALSATTFPAGTSVSFSPDPVTPGNSTTVTLNNVNTLQNGTYTVIVSGTAGSITRTRTLTFNVLAGAGPSISTHPGSQAVCAGTDATFSVASANAISYQWQVSTNGGGSFTNIASATGTSYTVTGVTTALNNNQYRVIVAGQCNTTTSNAGVLTVQTAPSITDQPDAETLCTGSNNTFSVTASGTNLGYQWQISTDGGATFNNIPSANGSTYTVNGLAAGMNGDRYRVVVTGTCSPAATSNAALLTVITPVTVTDEPDEVTICETGNVTFTVAGSGADVLYQWQVSEDGVNYTNIGGAISSTLNVNAVTAAMDGNLYRALLSNPTCTTPVASASAELTVNARPTVTLAATPSSTLLPGQSATLTATILPSATGFDITWYKDGTIIPGVNGTTYVVDSVEIGDYRVDIVNQETGCNNQSNVLTIGTSASERLFIFPTPNNGQFTVSYYNSAGTASQRSVTIYDSKGSKVYARKFAVNGPYTLMNINIQPAQRGIYYVVVGDAGGKVLVEGKVLVAH